MLASEYRPTKEYAEQLAGKWCVGVQFAEPPERVSPVFDTEAEALAFLAICGTGAPGRRLGLQHFPTVDEICRRQREARRGRYTGYLVCVDARLPNGVRCSEYPLTRRLTRLQAKKAFPRCRQKYAGAFIVRRVSYRLV